VDPLVVTSRHKPQRTDLKKRPSSQLEKVNWGKWLEHWETWNAMVGEVKPPVCGLFGCDEKVKVQGKWKCVACRKITDTAA
jgi:hypothetical protein